MYDMILIGGGLANGLIAWWMSRLHPQSRLLLVEQQGTLGGNHTWSFYENDLSPEQLALLQPLIAFDWPGYEVRFPAHRRMLGTRCCSITSERLHAVLTQSLKDAILLNASVGQIGRGSAVINGLEHTARVVVDGRGHLASPSMRYAYQKFLGQEIELDAPHGQTLPIIMDATVAQDDGYRFVYTLPLTARRILVEDTYYSLTPDLDQAALRQRIARYRAVRGWRAAQLVREETGILPIALSGNIERFWDQDRAAIACSGLRAGLFHATTGYSLLFAVRLAERLAALETLDADAAYRCVRSYSEAEWRRQGFMRLLNRMLFFASPAAQRYRLLQRFYTLPQSLIERFYAARLTRRDRLRILTGKPPVPLLPALRAAMDTALPPEGDLSSKPS